MKTKSTPKLEEFAQRSFSELTKVANNGDTITYGELSNKIGTHPYYVLPKALGRLWTWCEESGYPHINALVINRSTGFPGKSYRPDNRPTTKEEWKAAWREVQQFEWCEINYS